MQELMTWLKGRSKLWVVGAGLVATMIASAVDYWVGPDNEVPILYVLVVLFVTWFAGRAAGVFIAVTGAMAIFAASLRPPIAASECWVAGWKAAMGLAVFLTVALLVAHARSLQDQLKGKIQQLSKVIVECRQAEKRAQTSQAKLGIYVDTAVDGIITIDDQGIIDTFNPAAERIFGYKAHEVIGKEVRILMPPPYRNDHSRYMDNYLTTGQGKIIGSGREVSGLRKDGSVFPMELTVGEVRLGEQQLFTGTLRDISRRRQLEQDVLEISDQERQRIAQDLHDGLCQHLTGTEFAAQVLAENLADELPARAAEAKQIAGFVKRAITQAHEIARGLQPVEIGPGGLVSALDELSVMTLKLFGVTCVVQADDVAALLDNKEATHIYRIAQEAVTNAVKHGKPSQILIGFSAPDGQIVLTVKDNGLGFPEQLGEHNGMGLNTMNYRAHILGATLTIGRDPNGGTAVVLSLPKRAAGRRGDES